MSRRLWLVLGVLLASGCSPDRQSPTQPALPAGPAADSPVNAVRRLEWIWENRDSTALHGLLTDDFRFVFARSDSAGNGWGGQWSRAIEEFATRLLFAGGHPATEPAATSVSIVFDPNLRSVADPRPGKNPRWHRQISTTVALSVRFPNTTLAVQGAAVFFTTRGDSALIPPDLLSAGTDTSRWWIDRWEDNTLQSEAPRTAHPLPQRSSTWGSVKGIYLHAPTLRP